MKIRLNQVKKQFDKILTRREDREKFAQLNKCPSYQHEMFSKKRLNKKKCYVIKPFSIIKTIPILSDRGLFF